MVENLSPGYSARSFLFARPVSSSQTGRVSVACGEVAATSCTREGNVFLEVGRSG